MPRRAGTRARSPTWNGPIAIDLVEPVERLAAAVAVKGPDADAGKVVRPGLDAVRVGDAAALADESERRGGPGSGEHQRRVEARGGEGVNRGRHVGGASVDRGVGAESLGELDPILPRGDGEHADAETLRELQGEMTHAAASAQDQERLSRREL